MREVVIQTLTREAFAPFGTYEPVSYTHLDVYKRQGNMCTSTGLQRSIAKVR